MRLWPPSFALCALCRLFVYSNFLSSARIFCPLFVYAGRVLAAPPVLPRLPLAALLKIVVQMKRQFGILHLAVRTCSLFTTHKPVKQASKKIWKVRFRASRKKGSLCSIKLINFCFWLKRNQNKPNAPKAPKQGPNKRLNPLWESCGPTRVCATGKEGKEGKDMPRACSTF